MAVDIAGARRPRDLATAVGPCDGNESATRGP